MSGAAMANVSDFSHVQRLSWLLGRLNELSPLVLGGQMQEAAQVARVLGDEARDLAAHLWHEAERQHAGGRA